MNYNGPNGANNGAYAPFQANLSYGPDPFSNNFSNAAFDNRSNGFPRGVLAAAPAPGMQASAAFANQSVTPMDGFMMIPYRFGNNTLFSDLNRPRPVRGPSAIIPQAHFNHGALQPAPAGSTFGFTPIGSGFNSSFANLNRTRIVVSELTISASIPLAQISHMDAPQPQSARTGAEFTPTAIGSYNNFYSYFNRTRPVIRPSARLTLAQIEEYPGASQLSGGRAGFTPIGTGNGNNYWFSNLNRPRLVRPIARVPPAQIEYPGAPQPPDNTGAGISNGNRQERQARPPSVVSTSSASSQADSGISCSCRRCGYDEPDCVCVQHGELFCPIHGPEFPNSSQDSGILSGSSYCESADDLSQSSPPS